MRLDQLGVVLVELGPGVLGGQAVEVGEHVGETALAAVGLGVSPVSCTAQQVVYEDLWVDALLYVQGRRVDH